MAIEIRQLVVKSNVLQRCGGCGGDSESSPEQSKRDVLEEVRGMIAEALRKQKER